MIQDRCITEPSLTNVSQDKTFLDDLQKHASIKLQDVRAWALKTKGLLT